ncbi:SCP-like extracellular protein [Phytophthora megakarya]|uniref:SCP-like extracellular protein n=1 Tax=Phytophthora megakarya TaxID=4795 RepID=A0A225V173_9STRA|nr:SCP-like extracellular protein [Phytophthora megakarya]
MVAIFNASLALLIAIAAASTGNTDADILRHESRNLAATYTSTSQYASLMLASVNDQRATQGLRPLCINNKLMAAAQRHSDDMAAKNFMSHTGSDGSTMTSRITATGYNWNRIAENVAAGQVNVAAVMTSWMNSPGHRANILGDYTMFGTAYAYSSTSTYKHYWTQDFGKSTTESCNFEDIEYVEPPALNGTDSTDNSTAVLPNDPPTDSKDSNDNSTAVLLNDPATDSKVAL